MESLNSPGLASLSHPSHHSLLSISLSNQEQEQAWVKEQQMDE